MGQGFLDIEIEQEISHQSSHHKTGQAKLDIVFEDEHIIVINKPAGLDSVRGMYSAESVLDRLESQLATLDEPVRVIHRLDRDTSGLMVLAKTLEAQKNLSKQWQEHSVEKLYLALVEGFVYPERGTIDMPLSKTDRRAKPVVVDMRKGKQAITEYQVVNQFRKYALVQAKICTGRMHQIRVHFASRGFPIICDKHYGSKDALFLSQFKKGYKPSHRKPQRPLIARLALHSYKLTFEHPHTGKQMSFEVNPPKDFSSAVNQLKKFGQ